MILVPYSVAQEEEEEEEARYRTYLQALEHAAPVHPRKLVESY
jgi:hypothetical protein